MIKREDQVIFGVNPGNAWSGNIGVAVMPPTEQFKPGDFVYYYDRPECTGLIVAKFQREVEYRGLSTFTRELAKDNFVAKTMMIHYAVLWHRGTLKIAPECHSHQLRMVDGIVRKEA